MNKFDKIKLTVVTMVTFGYFLFLWAFVDYWLNYTAAQSVPCATKKNGDADCKADGTGKYVTIVDFEIWRKEFMGLCSDTNKTTTACQGDDDADGSLMDANFDYPGSGLTNPDLKISIADFQIWRTGYFGNNNPTATPTTTTPTVTTVPPTTTPVTGCIYPAQVLSLTNWKITLPIGSGGSPTEIKPPAIQTYKIDPWFIPMPDCSGVRFRAHTSSTVTTSSSSYPRSELRERLPDGSLDIAWSNASGTHTMFIDQKITSVPRGKRHVVAGQVHDSNDDVTVFRLELPDNSTTNVGSLYVTDGNNTHAKLITGSYTLGTRFQVKIAASPGKIEMYYKENAATAFTLVHTFNKTISGAYFKAGAYTQSNCTRETEYGSQCADDNYGEVIIYNLTAQHTP